MLLNLTASGRHSYHHNTLYNHVTTTDSFPLKLSLQKAYKNITIDEPFVFIAGNSKPPSYPFKESGEMLLTFVKFNFLNLI